MKVVSGIVAVFVLVALFFIFGGSKNEEMKTDDKSTVEIEEITEEKATQAKTTVTNGSYTALTGESRVLWAGKKPLIDGYVNTGSMALKSGVIEVVGDKMTGEFTIDMNTISVSETPTKPGSESKLEEHLKSERWFNVTEFPEAKFVITEVIPQADSETTFKYDVRGSLTMKGVTNELVFPALIYTNETGRTVASADLEFNRTLWGITAGSGSFFDNLADNVIDDMVALSFELVTEKQ